jgi:hypothetical protein
MLPSPLLDSLWLSKDEGLDWCSIIEHHVFAKCADAGGNDRSMLSRVKEDVSRYLRSALEPVWVVKRSAIDTKYLGESLKVEKKLCTAGRAETDG